MKHQVGSKKSCASCQSRRALFPALLLVFLAGWLPPTAFAQSTLADGLVAHYPFDGNANDAGTNANHGIVYGALADLNRHGVLSSSLKFTGTTNWVRLNIGPTVFANDFTIAVWIKVDDFQASWPTIIGGDSGFVRLMVLGSTPGHISGGYLGKIGFYQFEPSPWNQFGGLVSSAPLDTNQWYHLAVTKSGLSYRLYLNGDLSDQKNESNTGPLTGSHLQVGNDLSFPDNQHYFHGNMDDIRIYNRALSTNEIKFLVTQLHITHQPQNAGTLPGGTATFSVAAAVLSMAIQLDQPAGRSDQRHPDHLQCATDQCRHLLSGCIK